VSGGTVVVVYLSDRAQRLAYDRALRAESYTVRLASRPAELAKALADGRALVVIHGAECPGDGVVADTVATLTVGVDETPSSILQRVRALSLRP